MNIKSLFLKEIKCGGILQVSQAKLISFYSINLNKKCFHLLDFPITTRYLN
jgi:hypothetical protein